MKKIIEWFRKKNEFTFVVILIALIWHFVPMLLRVIDPEAGEFGVEMLYVPLIAGIYFFIGLLFVWAYMALVWPAGYKLLDEVFNENQGSTKWEKLQVLLRLFACLVALYAVSLLAVTGISAIM